MSAARSTAKFIGVGVGPGDPELLTLKAARYIKSADVISYIANAKGESQAKTIARAVLDQAGVKEELPIFMPMEQNRSRANQAYDAASVNIITALQQGKTVVFLCEGDPLFFGSFAYLLERVQPVAACEVVAGISSVNAAAASMCQPLTMQGESFAVVSGRHSQNRIESCLLQHDSVVILKAGRSRQRIIRALIATNRCKEARYLEYIGRSNQRIVTDMGELSEPVGPYFSLFVVLKSQRDRGISSP